MIFYWLRKAWLALAWLFTPPTAKALGLPRLDQHAACPVCGSKRGSLKCVEVQSAKGNRGVADKVIMARHTCGVCLARWFESPVVKVGPDTVWPAESEVDNKYVEKERKVQAA